MSEILRARELARTYDSNGATVFAKSVKYWKGFAGRFQRVSFIDGRAMVNDVRNAINALGRSSNYVHE